MLAAGLCPDGAGGRACCTRTSSRPTRSRSSPAIFRIGWAYLWPCLLAGIALAFTVLGVFGLLYKMPRMWMEAVALWAYWVFVFYSGHGVDPHDGADLPRPRPRPRLVPPPPAMGDVAAAMGKLYANSMRTVPRPTTVTTWIDLQVHASSPVPPSLIKSTMATV